MGILLNATGYRRYIATAAKVELSRRTDLNDKLIVKTSARSPLGRVLEKEKTTSVRPIESGGQGL